MHKLTSNRETGSWHRRMFWYTKYRVLGYGKRSYIASLGVQSSLEC